MELERSVFLIGYGAVDTIAYSYSLTHQQGEHSSIQRVNASYYKYK